MVSTSRFSNGSELLTLEVFHPGSCGPTLPLSDDVVLYMMKTPDDPIVTAVGTWGTSTYGLKVRHAVLAALFSATTAGEWGGVAIPTALYL
jgi:hypothetical protein